MSNICRIWVKTTVLWALEALLLLGAPLCAQADMATILVTQAYHVNDRTRVVLETSRPVDYQMLMLKSPDRLVLDMQDVKLDETLRAIAGKIREGDPYIRRVRMAYFKPRVVRVVFDLKGEVKPSLFTLVPMGEYRDRLVLDIFPPNGLPAGMAESPVKNLAVQFQKLEVIPTQASEVAVEPKSETVSVESVLPAVPAKTAVVAVLKTPVMDMEPGTDAAENAMPPNNDKTSVSGIGLVMTTLLAGCLLLLLL